MSPDTATGFRLRAACVRAGPGLHVPAVRDAAVRRYRLARLCFEDGEVARVERFAHLKCLTISVIF